MTGSEALNSCVYVTDLTSLSLSFPIKTRKPRFTTWGVVRSNDMMYSWYLALLKMCLELGAISLIERKSKLSFFPTNSD